MSKSEYEARIEALHPGADFDGIVKAIWADQAARRPELSGVEADELLVIIAGKRAAKRTWIAGQGARSIGALVGHAYRSQKRTGSNPPWKTGSTKTEPPVSGGTILEPPETARLRSPFLEPRSIGGSLLGPPITPRRRLPDEERARRIELRSRMARNGTVPHFVGGRLTMTETAVAVVVGEEVRRKGFCQLAHGSIAGRAACSRDAVRKAVRKFRRLGLISVQVVRRGWLNDFNVIRIACPLWARWLRHKPGRPYGVTNQPPSSTKIQGSGDFGSKPSELTRRELGKTSHQGCRRAGGERGG